MLRPNIFLVKRKEIEGLAFKPCNLHIKRIVVDWTEIISKFALEIDAKPASLCVNLKRESYLK